MIRKDTVTPDERLDDIQPTYDFIHTLSVQIQPVF